MKSGEIYIFTVRKHIRENPIITQERVFVEPFEYKLISYLDTLYSVEKSKDKKANRELLKTYKTEMYRLSHNREKFELFTTEGVYYKCFGVFQKAYEGWYNLKKK